MYENLALIKRIYFNIGFVVMILLSWQLLSGMIKIPKVYAVKT